MRERPPIRLLVVTTEYPPVGGGIGQYVAQLNRALMVAQPDLSIHVLVRSKKARNRQETFLHEGQEHSFSLEETNPPLFPPVNNRSFSSMIEKTVAQKGPFDLVHLHSSSLPVPNVSIPVVATAHSCFGSAVTKIHVPPKHPKDIARIAFLPWYKQVEKNISTQVAHFTTVSQCLMQQFSQLYSAKGTVILNAVDTGRFYPNDTSDKLYDAVFVGLIGRGKGVWDIFETIRLLANCGLRVSTFLVGNGPDKDQLQKKARRYHLADLFQFPGSLFGQELVQAYQSAKILFFPSHYEGLPTVVLESMACGLPIVGWDIPAMKEVVDGNVGILAGFRNSLQLANSVRKLVSETDTRSHMGKLARQRVLERYTWDQLAKRVLDIYYDLVP